MVFGLAMLLEVNVDVDCRNQDNRFYHILPCGLHIQHLQPGGQTGDDQCADLGSGNGAYTT